MEIFDSFPFSSLKQLVFGGAALVAGIIIGVAASPYLPFSPHATDRYQEGFDAAKALVAKSSLGGLINTPNDIRTLSGTVTAISGTSLTLHTVSNDPFGDPSLSDRTVLAASSTRVMILSPKDPVAFQSELDAFQGANRTSPSSGQGASPVTLPQPFIQTVASIADIKIGDFLVITAVENIKTMKEFEASEIKIQPSVEPIPLKAK